MVLDLILCKSTEENFLCSVQNLQAASTRLSGQQQHKARRLSLQFHDRNLGVVESAGRINLPHVRSLIVFGWPAPSLALFELKFLRVLYIVRAADDLDLTLICKLFQLRYLCIRGKHRGLQLPEEISGLKHLQVLDVISGLSASGIPRDVVYLPALLHLQFPLTAVYPDGIGSMRCLHTLLQFDASKQSVANMLALGELLNLRVLDLWINDASFATKEAHMDALMSSLEKLISCNLKTMSILARDNVGRHRRWSSLCFSCSQAQLEQLHLYVWCPRMPAWVCQLRALSILKIKVVELCKDDVAVLAGLPALSRLILDVRRSNNVPGQQAGIVFRADTSFRLLDYLRIPYDAETGITFEAGSMPQVETLRFPLRADDVKRWGVRFSGIEHLPNLKQVLVDLRYGDCDESERPVIRAAVRSAFDAHSAPSSIQFEFY
jgi:disease resistance protein RPM1